MSELSQFFGGGTLPFDLDPNAILAEVLLVGGGGGGGSPSSQGFSSSGEPRGAGGGAGRLIFFDTILKVGNQHLITVGAGGTGGNKTAAVQNVPAAAGSNGQASVFGNVSAVGGGGGAGANLGSAIPTTPGGSGGGSAIESTTIGGEAYVAIYPPITTGTSGVISDRPLRYFDLGNNGGAGFSNGSFNGTVSGSGGGARRAGTKRTTSVIEGDPGEGLILSITGTEVEYARGGAGRAFLQGGGVGPSGAANTGNGGGGSAGFQNFRYEGGDGGSGIVVIAYPNTYPAITTIPGTLTFDQPVRAGYRVYRFTAGTGTITI